MGDNYGQFFEKPYRPLDKMTKDELGKELLQWRNLWTWLDPEVQYWITKVGERVRVTTRNGITSLGTLGLVKFNPLIISVAAMERLYDYSRGEATYETKDVQIKVTDLVSYSFIYNEEVKSETFDGREEGVPGNTPSELD